MELKLTVEVLSDGTPVAQGIISGDLDITNGSGMHSTDPILTVKMRNILAAVKQQIFEDSNDV